MTASVSVGGWREGGRGRRKEEDSEVDRWRLKNMTAQVVHQ